MGKAPFGRSRRGKERLKPLRGKNEGANCSGRGVERVLLLCDPGSELRLNKREKIRAKAMNGKERKEKSW